MSEARVLEIQPATTRGTLMTALLPTLAAAGVSCSEARLAGILHVRRAESHIDKRSNA
jgi:hypothetical protein